MDNLSKLQDERKAKAAICRNLDQKRCDSSDKCFTEEQRAEFIESKERIQAIDAEVEKLREAADAAAFVSRLDGDKEIRDRDHHEKRGTGQFSLKDRQRAFNAKYFKNELQRSAEEKELISRFHTSDGTVQGLLSRAPKTVEEIQSASFEGDKRAMNTTNAAGTVPDELMRELEIALKAHGGVRENATVIRTASGSDLPIPTANDASNSGAILDEGSQVADLDPSISQLVLGAFKYSSKQVKVSVELMEDSSVDMASFLGQALGTRLARITNNHFTVGTGSSQPKGITVAAADSSVETAAVDAVTRDELVSTMMSVDPSYRANGKWMFSDTVLQYILKLTDNTNQPLWLPGNGGPIGDTILGMPYVVNQDMPTGAGAKGIVFGDLSKYMVREVTDIQFLQLNERYADYHQVGFLAFLRADGDLLDAGTNPVKYATLKS